MKARHRREFIQDAGPVPSDRRGRIACCLGFLAGVCLVFGFFILTVHT
jgi:hypothetical protein